MATADYLSTSAFLLTTHTHTQPHTAGSFHAFWIWKKKHQLETSHFSRCEPQYLNFNAHRFQCTSMLRLVLVEYIFCAAGNRITYWYTFPFSQPTETGFLFSQSERQRMNEKKKWKNEPDDRSMNVFGPCQILQSIEAILMGNDTRLNQSTDIY